jgi:hypothetical protein
MLHYNRGYDHLIELSGLGFDSHWLAAPGNVVGGVVGQALQRGLPRIRPSSSPVADPMVGEVAQHRGIDVRDAHDGGVLAWAAGPPAAPWPVVDDEVAARERVAELRDEDVDEVVEHGVLKRLGVAVDVLPGMSRLSRREELRQAVAADDPQREALAGAVSRTLGTGRA